MEYVIEKQQYYFNRDKKRAYYYLIGILLLFIVHITTIILPNEIKPYFYYVYFVPLYWILIPGNRMFDRRSYRQKWIEDFSGISILGIIILIIIMVYGSIILCLVVGANNYQFQYYGMLLCEIFWLFILTIGFLSSWYRKWGPVVTKDHIKK